MVEQFYELFGRYFADLQLVTSIFLPFTVSFLIVEKEELINMTVTLTCIINPLINT